jgi:CheY-like chemotaxis protein
VDTSTQPGVLPSPTAPPLSVLVVDDHPDTVEVFQRLLKMAGFDPHGVRTCADALAAAERQRFDLVVCDLGLSDGDGCDLFRQLRQKYNLRGIVYSGYGGPEDVERSRAAGFTCHLLKPAQFPDLLAAMRAALADGYHRSADAVPPASPPPSTSENPS